MFDLQGYEASILKGAVLTIEVALLSLILAMVLGMLGALAKLAPYRWARAIATLYTNHSRHSRSRIDDADFLWWTNPFKQQFVFHQ